MRMRHDTKLALVSVGLMALIMALGACAFMGLRSARGAELKLPPMIMCGAQMCDARGTYYPDGPVDRFGMYSLEYYVKRWERMCKTGARYDAMREADDFGKGNPCQ